MCGGNHEHEHMHEHEYKKIKCNCGGGAAGGGVGFWDLLEQQFIISRMRLVSGMGLSGF